MTLIDLLTERLEKADRSVALITNEQEQGLMGGDEMELVEEGRFLVNLRAEGDATILQKLVHRALEEQMEAEVNLQNEAAFQPGKPEPTHRVG